MVNAEALRITTSVNAVVTIYSSNTNGRVIAKSTERPREVGTLVPPSVPAAVVALRSMPTGGERCRVVDRGTVKSRSRHCAVIMPKWNPMILRAARVYFMI